MSPPDLERLLREQRDHIVARFVSEVQRKDLPPDGVLHSLLVDHIPGFIDEIIAELARLTQLRMSQDAVDTSETARRHGGQRWRLGYDLEALIREYGVLRHCILDAAKEAHAAISVDEFDILAKCLSVGVAEAATEYVRYRDEQLDVQKGNLAFLAEAGQILSSSLDYRSTLTHLTGLIVPRLADSCVVHLDDNDGDIPIAHVDPAMVEVMRDMYRRFPASADHPPYAHHRVMRTGEPELVRDVSRERAKGVARSPEHLALLEQLDVRSAVIVPLRVQEHTFGALELSYGPSGRAYSEQDLVLVTELARRAAAAIDNARLYDMSQRERSRVEAATRAKDEFVAMVSHELRTPLNAMLGWVRLIRGGALTEEKRAHGLEVIERNAHAQDQLVSDLLDISRVITGKVRINPSQVDLSNVADMAIEGIRPAADAKRIEITSDLDRDNAVMRGDGDRLQQVVWNLLSNAIKFTPKGGKVGARLRRVESDLELVVRDTGEGITEDFLPHVFDSFRQSDSSVSRPHGGLGIGLSIAKHIVELHGGTIRAASEGVGRGATFTVLLPISPLVSATLGIPRVPATRETAPDIALPRGPDGLRVLVVDDEPDARELVAYVLETCGMGVRMAASAAEALAVLQTYAPHVLISDIGMPGEDGYSLIRSIRTLPDAGGTTKTSQTPAIALTAFARNEDRARALVEGFNLHMTKPVEPAALVQAVIDLAGSQLG